MGITNLTSNQNIDSMYHSTNTNQKKRTIFLFVNVNVVAKIYFQTFTNLNFMA